MLALNKLLAIFYGAEKTGFKEMEFPIVHALAFFLSRRSVLSINDRYSFASDYYPSFGPFESGLLYPSSVGLTKDLCYLRATECLTSSFSSAEKLSLTNLGKKKTIGVLEAQKGKVNGMEFDSLLRTIKDCLADKRQLIDECYRIYLRGT